MGASSVRWCVPGPGPRRLPQLAIEADGIENSQRVLCNMKIGTKVTSSLSPWFVMKCFWIIYFTSSYSWKTKTSLNWTQKNESFRNTSWAKEQRCHCKVKWWSFEWPAHVPDETDHATTVTIFLGKMAQCSESYHLVVKQGKLLEHHYMLYEKIICKCAIFNIIHVCFPGGRYFGFRVTTSLGTRPTKQRLRRQSVETPDGGWGGSVHDPSGCCAQKLRWVYTQQISIELFAAFWIHNVCRTILPKTAGSTKPYPTVTFLCFFNYHVC